MPLHRSDKLRAAVPTGPSGETIPGRGFGSLWIVISGLWTVATLLRVKRVWVPIFGWHETLVRPLFWIILIAPPSLFALILGAVRRRMKGRQ